MEPLNEFFLLRYALRHQAIKQTLLEGVRPVMVRLADQMFFLHRERKQVAAVLSDAYHRAKEIAHVPLALHLWLSEQTEIALDEHTLAAIQERRQRLQAEQRSETGDAHALLGSAIDFLTRAYDARRVSEGLLQQLARDTAKATRALMLVATQDELSTLDRVVSAWTRDFRPADWRVLRVLICSNHQARYRESTTLYFQRLLCEHNEPGAKSERRVIYAENARSEDEAVSLLATHELDQELAAAFLGDAFALQENVLGDAAKEVVRELLPEPKPKP